MVPTSQVKLWVQLLIPRIEDGGNFGVSIQEETLGEVMRVETECVGIMERFSRYYMARAKFMSKCMKYPHMEDYVLAVQEVDMRFYLTMRITITELRNHYVCRRHTRGLELEALAPGLCSPCAAIRRFLATDARLNPGRASCTITSRRTWRKSNGRVMSVRVT